MIPTFTDFLLPATVAFLLVLVTTPLTIIVAKHIGLIDDPKRKHPAIVHTKPTPRGGGLPMALGIVLTSLIFLGTSKILLMILLGAVLAVVIGLLDDKYDLSPYLRFLSNFFVASFPVLAGITILFITNPLGSGGVISFQNVTIPFGLFGKDTIILLADLIAIVWIVWTMNMLNWSTGVNGQMPGIAAIAAVTIGILSLRFSPLDDASILTASLSFITAGAALGFLPFNFPKARIFPGYGGTIIGFMLATLSILSSAKVATALLVMGVPTIDALFTLIRRITAGKSPFRGDRGHFHHLLLQKGWKDYQVAIFYWVMSVLLGVAALSFSSKEKFFALLVLTIFVGGGLLWLSLFSKD